MFSNLSSLSFLHFTVSVWRKAVVASLLVAGMLMVSCKPDHSAQNQAPLPEELKGLFTPPPEYAGKMGEFRSPLLFESGEKVQDKGDWEKRRTEIKNKWHGLMGQWPEIIHDPHVEYLDTAQRGDITQHRLKLEVAPGWTRDAVLLIPPGKGPMPAALVVYYEANTPAGLGKLSNRDFAFQLAKRGFVALALGSQSDRNYYPDSASAKLQPLSMLAYMAANSYEMLARLPYVDKDRIGVVGHSYGGKWAMFASCLYDKFALGVWSDGGVVFDEARANVNYWEPWYLGYEPNHWRKEGVVTETNGRTGAYKKMIENHMDLHELHALMAPRPFLVSGGSEDQVSRWPALNHAVAVNKFLGYENRVAMHNRPTHGPNEESNEVVYKFFEYFLKE